MQSHFRSFLMHFRISICVLPLMTFALPSGAAEVCANDKQALAAIYGEYANDRVLQALRLSRTFDEATPLKTGGISAVHISAKGVIVSRGWHEAETTQCVQVERNQIRVPNSELSFTRIGSRDSTRDSGDYFDILFSGCLRDEGEHRWCFSTNSIEIDGQKHRADLQLDSSETWGGNPVHIDGDHAHFWIFKPGPNGRWNVFNTGWASDSSPEPNWNMPWHVLTPAATPSK